MTDATAGSTPENLRRRNLRQVLRLAHQDGPLSRSDLTRATGLNRSTIAALVADLIDRGLVDEQEAMQTRRAGRPSPRVVGSDSTTVIAVNPEIDAIDVALVALSGIVRRRVRYVNETVPTVAEFVKITAAIVAGLLPMANDMRVLGISIAVPGLVRRADGMVLLAPHLGWRDQPVAQLLADATGLEVVAGNDAQCGVIAESTFGAGRGKGVVVYVNGGASGIGSGIVIDGKLIAGESGLAGEFGHTTVNSVGTICHCGARGCLETEVRRDRFIVEAELDTPDAVAMSTALRAAASDPSSRAGQELERQRGFLGVALRTIVNGLNPRTIVLGGYLSQLLEVIGDQSLKDAVGATLPGGLADVKIVGTALGDEILLVGAAELAFAPVLDDPTRIESRQAATA